MDRYVRLILYFTIIIIIILLSLYVLGSLNSYPLLLKQTKRNGIEYANLLTSLPNNTSQYNERDNNYSSHLDLLQYNHFYDESRHQYQQHVNGYANQKHHDHNLYDYFDHNRSDHKLYDHHLHMMLIDYFQLHIKLQPLYHQWATSCDRMAIVTRHLPGNCTYILYLIDDVDSDSINNINSFNFGSVGLISFMEYSHCIK